MMLSKKARKLMTIIVGVATVALIIGSLISSLPYLFR